jgi:hypothetical protein
MKRKHRRAKKWRAEKRNPTNRYAPRPFCSPMRNAASGAVWFGSRVGSILEDWTPRPPVLLDVFAEKARTDTIGKP